MSPEGVAAVEPWQWAALAVVSQKFQLGAREKTVVDGRVVVVVAPSVRVGVVRRLAV